MKRIRIEESALRHLEEQAARVPELAESLRVTRERVAVLEAEASQLRRIDEARTLIEAAAREAGVIFNRLQVRGLLMSLKVTESGELDREALQAIVDDEIWTMRLNGAVDVHRVIREHQEGR